MNPQTESETPHPAEHETAGRSGDSPFPANWKDALQGLASSRIALIQHESREAAGQVARRVVAAIAAVICVFFTWALLVAGGIAIVSDATGWRWGWVTIGAAAIHLLAAVIFARTANSRGAETFPITRSEFQKDREWITNLQKARKSNA